MSATVKCSCADNTYRLASTPLKLDVCHYKNCQRQAGASFIPFVAVTLMDVEVEGTTKGFMDDDTVSGNTVARHFCGGCGSPIYMVGEGTQDGVCHQRHAGSHGSSSPQVPRMDQYQARMGDDFRWSTRI